MPTEATSYVRGQLGRVLFSGDDVTKKVGSLSGGEAARLVFCRIMVARPNVLVLDEPTNHLDLEAIHALVAALKSFEGALLFVSHDRAFVSALATRILEVTARGFRDFPGTYDEYLGQARRQSPRRRRRRAPREEGATHRAAAATGGPTPRRGQLRGVTRRRSSSAPTLSWDEQKRRKNRRKQLPSLRDAAVQAIEAAEARKAAIHARWCEPGFYEDTPADEIAALEAEERALGPRIVALVGEWEALEKELEEAERTAS